MFSSSDSGPEYTHVNTQTTSMATKKPVALFNDNNESAFQKLLLAALCFCGGVVLALVWYDWRRPPLPELPELGLIAPTKSTFHYRESIVLNFANQDPDPTDWIGLFMPHDYTNRSVMWQYTCGGTEPCYTKRGKDEEIFGGELHFDQSADLFSDYNLTWPLCSGEYKACIVTSVIEGAITRNETLACSDVFTVDGEGPCIGFNGGGL